jgi:4-hydroxy-3-polyprenylbenzoate decarboxylase
MGYPSLKAAANDLEKHQMLIRINQEVDPELEIAEIHRRVYDQKGPAILFEKVKGSPFQALSNLYGTIERTEFLFRNELRKVEKLIQLKADPTALLRNPFKFLDVPFTALKGLPSKSRFQKQILFGQTTIDQLPLIKSWPDDGGAFVTLPQVITLPPHSNKIMESNVGMYRVQLNGNEYALNEEVGIHYQLHRGIGVHHTLYNMADIPFLATVAIGGPPSNAFAAIMPLPEGLSELSFAGLLNGSRFKYLFHEGHVLSTQADFCITGTIMKNTKKPEGPFGDHLGYYSLEHDFPVLKVDKVYHRKDAIWHFTVVGRPPQEDSSFGHLIHELVGPITPTEFPGLVELNAVDAAGVHPLLLAIGKERYMPFREKVPEEILTIASHLLGKGQTSLAKYLIIASDEDAPQLSTHKIDHFFNHVLERVDWTRDLHFHTKTTIDTLDYSGQGWNAGSKLVIACRGEKKRKLDQSLPSGLSLPKQWENASIVIPGICAIQGKAFTSYPNAEQEMDELTNVLQTQNLQGIPLILIVDHAAFTAQTLNNFIWVTFTRSNPSHDIYGVGSKIEFKHWGCTGPLIIDARIKPHHAPELVPDPEVSKRVDKIMKNIRF